VITERAVGRNLSAALFFPGGPMAKPKTIESVMADFPKLTYRVSSPQGSHRTHKTYEDAIEQADDFLKLDYVCKAWVAVDKITVERVYVRVKP